MSIRRFLLTGLFVLSAWTFGGCVRIEQDIEFEPDGSGAYTLDLGVRDDLVDPQAIRSPLPINRLVEELRNNPHTATITSTRYTDAGYTHIRVTAEATDLCAFLEALSAGGSPLFQYELVEENAGYFRFKQYFYPAGDQWTLPADPELLAELSEALADSYWTVRITAPRLRNPGQQFDRILRSDEYRVPLVDLVNGKRTVIKTILRPRNVVRDSWLWLIITYLLLILTHVFVIASIHLIPRLNEIAPRTASTNPGKS